MKRVKLARWDYRSKTILFFLYELKPVTGLNLIATGVFFWRQLPFGEHFLCAGACAVGEGRHCCPQGHMAKGKGRAPDHKVPPLWGPLVSHLCSPKHGVTVDSLCFRFLAGATST